MKQPKDDPKFIKNKKKIKYIIKFKYKLNSNFMALTNPNSTKNTKHQLTTLTLSSYS